MDNEENKYLFPVEELDKYITQIDEGIEIFADEKLLIEIELRRKELANKLFGGSEEETAYQRQLHQEMMREHIKQQAKKAKRDDVLVIELNEDQKRAVRESVETSIVRPDPNLPYNMSADELYESAEHKLLMEKVGKIRVQYFNQADYQVAINVIMQAIEYSLTHDYPWMSKDEAIRAFNEGRIQFTGCQIPKLFINFRTQIKDPNILKGVVEGNVELVDRNDNTYQRKNYDDSPLVPMPVSVFSKEEEQYYMDAHRRGEFTPLSGIIQSKNTIYNRFAPLSVASTKKNKFIGLTDKDDNPITFDWTQDNAHEKYMMLRDNKPFDISMMMSLVNQQNHGVNPQIAANMQAYIRAINSTSLTSEEKIVPGYKEQNAEVLKTEQDIINKIMADNVLK